MAWEYLRQGWLGFLRKHWPLLLFVLLFYLAGIIFGALGVRALSSQQAGDLSSYLDLFFDKLASLPLTGEGAGETVWGQVKVVIAIYLLGLSVLGAPAVLVLIFTRGFILGFTVGFLVKEKALKGALFAFLSVLPHNILAIPALIISGVVALAFALALFRSRLGGRDLAMGQRFAGYTLLMLFLGALTAGAGLTEAYVTPVFMKLAATYLD